VACCQLRAQLLNTDTAFDAGNPATFVDLGFFELRSTAGGVAGQINICNTTPAGFALFTYAGGVNADSSEDRNTLLVGGNSCSLLDINDAQVGGQGDFRVLDPVDNVVVQGMNGATGGQLYVLAISF
jgi:hypothetical protein